MRAINWYREIKEINEDYFSYPWDDHLDQLNTSLDPKPEHRFMTPGPGLPPAWFNGNICNLPENDWILVLSHNPLINHTDEGTKQWYVDQEFDATGWWNYWSTFNLESPHRNLGFVRPLVRLATRAVNEPFEEDSFPQFAFDRMLFAEFCPYASGAWKLPPKRAVQLAQDDIGFRCAAEIRRVLIREGHPRMIFVQGKDVLADFEAAENHQLENQRVDWTWTFPYPSLNESKENKPPISFQHLEGRYRTDDGDVPLFGFNKIVRANGPQSREDINYLGGRMRSYVEQNTDGFAAFG